MLRNRLLTRLVRLRWVDWLDAFAVPAGWCVGGDGRLFVDGRRFDGSLLVNEYAATAELRGAESVASTRLFELWRPAGRPRLRLLAGGRFFDGWLANSGYVRVWDSPGRLVLRLTLPTGAAKTRLVFRARGVRRAVEVAPGAPAMVALDVPAGVWTVRWKGPVSYLPDGRPVSVRADELRLEP